MKILIEKEYFYGSWIRQIITDNNLRSVADVYTLLKDSFKDILQELMEGKPHRVALSHTAKNWFELFIH